MGRGNECLLQNLGALLSVVIIWALTVALLYTACGRFIDPPDVDGRLSCAVSSAVQRPPLIDAVLAIAGRTMFVTATFGLLVNIGMMRVLHQGGGGHGHSHGGSHGHSHGANINVQVR